MKLPCTLNLVFPILGWLLLKALDPGEEMLVTKGFLTWFLLAGVLQVTAALVLWKPSPKLWTWGWILLWISSALWMGAYSNLHLKTDGSLKAVSALKIFEPSVAMLEKELQDLGPEQEQERREKTEALEKKREDLEEALSAFEWGFGAEDPHAWGVETLEGRRSSLMALQYLVTFLFLGAFFSVAAFSGLGAQRTYRVEGGSTEDPLHVNVTNVGDSPGG